jgi:hypothetical protein
MTTTFNWAIISMSCSTTEANPDTVITASWLCAGSNGQYSAINSSLCVFPAPTGSFTPYAQLTQEQVLGWCYANGVDQAAVEAGIQSNIDSQINPPVVQLPLPWSTPAA